MANYSHNIYPGADYGFTSKYDESLGMQYHTPTSNIGIAVDPRTANQIRMVGERINTGTKVIEVQMLQPNVAESIPNQHLEEINRLKKLTGVDLTLHGPLVEPTGLTKQGWDEYDRVQAERQMWSALQRGHKLDPKGNLVVTFHASNGLPEPEMKIFDQKEKKEIVKEILAINERDGQMVQISPKENFMLQKTPTPMEELKEQNKKAWESSLSQVSFHVLQGKESIESGLALDRRISEKEDKNDEEFRKAMTHLWNLSKTEEGQKILQKEVFSDPFKKKIYQDKFDRLNHGEIYVKDAYLNLQEQFNKAWSSLQKTSKLSSDEKERARVQEDLKKLQSYREDIKKKQETLFQPGNIPQLSEEVQKGVNILNSISDVPQMFRPLKEFAIDKASETFSNVAVKAYNEFKNSSPIISIENPPAGMGLNRAEDLRELIDATRIKFVEKIQSEDKKISKEEAQKQAQKLIGATWDVGHINMIRKHGYDTAQLKEQTKILTDKNKEYLKHVHLSDNFGLEHTELPMGMGNVPTKEHMDLIDSYNKKVKKIIEAGDWYQHFQTTPFTETLAAFGSPIYAMNMSPYWNKEVNASGGYFSGYGFNPDVHHSLYGAGFSGLPTELGGQVPGNRSRFSGTAME